MNRIRKYNDTYQVLLTPNNNMSPDSGFLTGNWLDPKFQDFGIVNFTNSNDAMYEALKYPDINWEKIILDHVYIYKELYNQILNIIARRNLFVNIVPHLMSPDELKNEMFNRVMTYNNFNLFDNFTDIISFTIVEPWTKKLVSIGTLIERELYNYYKIQHKKIYFKKIIELIGYTPYGTTFQIRLIPNVLHQYIRNIPIVQVSNDNNFQKLLNIQNKVDNNYMII
ncbi:hypothetical protein Hokovirus_2_184 [Hokovirus HKV1]|uniref:Uncharacterized protein n=1 Tax=Hokovirus HKV1 TaxID=1977638 RepID=A0A1V0SG16_9VIRU|nr:hypothetical protein Hokovirus_2_184 [Hokovirus HKV1]